VRELVRQHFRFFLIATLAGVALRLGFVFWLPSITDDSRLYADIAKNWLQHGVYGLTENGNVVPTLTRLPGYPAFLALVFAIFGLDNFRAVLLLQLVVDIGTCWLVADIARRTLSPRAAKAAFLLAALCPFLANYAGAALTETLEVLFTALAFDLAIAGLKKLDGNSTWLWAVSGAAVAAAILLRPDGAMLLGAICLYLGIVWLQRVRAGKSHMTVLRHGVIFAIIAVAPLVPWTIRNFRTLHRFEPLAPRYANEDEELVPRGLNRWVKTWMADYVSVEEIYWNIPGEAVDPAKLPSRAFDSVQQREQTYGLLNQYNQQLRMTPGLDAQFALLAEERIRNGWLRYYLWLPALRIADMWMRPRTELLPSDPRWWEFNDDPKWSAAGIAFGLINLGYLAAAFAGLVRWPQISFVALLLTYVVLRSLFLGSLENPEPRYTLECYPMVFVLAAAWWSNSFLRVPSGACRQPLGQAAVAVVDRVKHEFDPR
jgi:4-amino-4-deoxy-L-arabinose transferase-like glycosyltransferase